MTREEGDRSQEPSSALSRRDFVALWWTVSMGAAASSLSGVIERDVEVPTPDGVCDAVFMYPETGSHPGVLIWHDSGGLRPAFRGLGRRIAAEGYSVLVPNLFYRAAKAPVFDRSLNPLENPADRETYRRAVAPFLAPGAAEKDASAYVSFLGAQRQVDRNRKIGTHGYCLGGPYILKTAAAMPDRVGAGASFHGGFLVTEKPDSPHLLAPRINGRLYFAIASDDDEREPEVKNRLKEAFAAANVPAEVEVYPNALHGFCVPDSKAANNKQDAEHAWSKLVALYKLTL
jgi:carboxymethylenebutenolidase